ncbi:M48 family metalloprotease [Streptosporangium sp. NPDC051022]|uniref:M48 family metalloprotease n=1 Tax=Streptosporangium sp. NPDC051022 TaxID=3155752 RepID=UPI00341A2E4C
MTHPKHTPKTPGALTVFDPAAVRISYAPPADDSTPDSADDVAETEATAAAAKSTDLPGLAALAEALRTAAHLPGVVVVVDSAIGDNAAAGGHDRCSRTPVLELGADLLGEPRRQVLEGTLAHEVAHLALGHPTRSWATIWRNAARAAVAGALLTAAAGWLQTAVVLAALTVALCLITVRVRRLEEYDADHYAVTLLDRLGQPGLQILTTMLVDAARDEPAWYSWGGWVAGEHPTAAARLRAVGRGMPAARHILNPLRVLFGLAR